MSTTRRRFLQALAAAAVTAHRLGRALPNGGSIPKRKIAGVEVSMLGIGGFHLGLPPEDEALRIVHAAIDHGVTFFDNCWDYNGGKSEERLGKALAGRRQSAFVMTKLDGRTQKSAAEQLEQSLRRLRTDVIDLIQVHEVIRMNDPERVFGPGGTMEALVAAKQAGKIRFIGFTGHKDPAIHLHMLDVAAKNGFHFDSVQMPVNVMDAHFKSFQKNVLPRLISEKIAALGMKPMGSGILLESGVVTAPECLRYTMSQPVSVAITGCDSMKVLEQALSIAIDFQPLGGAAQASLLQKTAGAAAGGRYEKFKTSQMFDGTAQHPEWLEEAKI